MMMNSLSHLRRASLTARPALVLSLLCFLLLSPFVSAQTGNRSRVSDSILGVRIGTSLEEAEKKLEKFSVHNERRTATEEDNDEPGTKRVWRLKGTNYSSVALKTNEKGRVVWVTGFVRPNEELPFTKLGDTSLAMRATDSQAIWNVANSNGGYRLVAKGQNGRARVIYLLSLATPAN
jgi:hypothetical protein